MGMRVTILREEPPYPRPTRLTLVCDGDRHARSLDLIGPLMQHFDDIGGFIDQYRSAMNAGWKDSRIGNRRVFLGPCCSGKAPR